MTPVDPSLRLAGVTQLSLTGARGPRRAFVFEPHRLAYVSWASALVEGPPPLLVTLDRHFDLVAPAEVAGIPERRAGLEAHDGFARWRLDVRNVDHVLAAMEAGFLGDAVVIARTRLPGAFEGAEYRDRSGTPHRIWTYATVEQAAADPALVERLRAAPRVALDVDLDCFTTPCDAEPTTVLPWPRAVIDAFLFPPGHEAFWSALLDKCALLTLARESAHCGGIVAGNRLFEDVADALFVRLFGADLP